MCQPLVALPETPGIVAKLERTFSSLGRHPILSAFAFGLLALATLLPGLGNPRVTFFDELYFVPEARALIQGVPNATPYVSSLAKPPLGKIMIALGMEVAGDSSFGWRIAGAICGGLTVVAIYLWTFVLLGDAKLAALSAALALFDNFLFVMSRIATVDTFLIFFLTWSLVTFTAALTLEVNTNTRRVLVCASGILVGLAGACKWNAMDTLATYGFVTLVLLLRGRLDIQPASALSAYGRNLRRIGPATLLIGLLILPLLSYALTFWPICRVLHLPFTVHQVAAINEFMWHFNRTTGVNPFIITPWYSWPLNLKPLGSLSYLVGNPVITWGGLVALGICVRQFWTKRTFPQAFVTLLFAANFLQWAVTPQKGLYYYYYYPCVMILGVTIAVVFRDWQPRLFRVRLSLLILLTAMIVFVRCYPQMAHLEAPWDCMLGCFPFH